MFLMNKTQSFGVPYPHRNVNHAFKLGLALVCDAVAVVKNLNANLVIPHLEMNPVWTNSSSFEEIYDADHFINVLEYKINIVRTLPDEYAWSTREYYVIAIRATRIKTAVVQASANWNLVHWLEIME